MNKFKSGLIKVGKFLKKNVYYVLIIVAVFIVIITAFDLGFSELLGLLIGAAS